MNSHYRLAEIGDKVMFKKAIVVGFTTALFWGNVVIAQYDPRQEYDQGNIQRIENQQLRKQACPDCERGNQQESRHCREPAFQGKDSITLQLRQKLGCKD